MNHTGSLPYLLNEMNVPVYGTKLTIELTKEKWLNMVSGKYDFREITGESVVSFRHAQSLSFM